MNMYEALSSGGHVLKQAARDASIGRRRSAAVKTDPHFTRTIHHHAVIEGSVGQLRGRRGINTLII